MLDEDKHPIQNDSNEKSPPTETMQFEKKFKKINELYSQGIGHLDAGKYLDAIKIFLKIEKYYNDNANFYHQLGVCYYEINDYEQAWHAFNLALSIDKSQAKYYHSRGLSSFFSQQYKEADEDFKSAIKLDNTVIDYFILLIQSEFRQTDFQAVIMTAKEALKYHQNDIFYFFTAIGYFWIPDYDLGLVYLKKCAKFDDDNTLIKSLLVNVFIRLGFSDELYKNDKNYEKNFTIKNLFSALLKIICDQKISITIDYKQLPSEPKILVKELISLENKFIELLKDTTVSFKQAKSQSMRIFHEIGTTMIALGDYYFKCHTQNIKNATPNLITARAYFDAAIAQLKKSAALGFPVDHLIGLALLKQQQELPTGDDKTELLTKAIKYLTSAIEAGENAYGIRAQAYLENNELDKAQSDINQFFEYKQITSENKFSDPELKTHSLFFFDAKKRQQLYRLHAKEESQMNQYLELYKSEF